MGSKETDINFVWRNVRNNFARAIAFSRAQETAEGLAGITLQSAIAEAIHELDSSTNDPITTLGERSAVVVETDPVIGSGVGKGKLQRVQDLLDFYYGTDETPGYFERLRELSEPDV